jgi:hypothetical protein
VSVEPQEGHLSVGVILNRSAKFAFAVHFDVSFDSSFGSIYWVRFIFPLNSIQQVQDLSLKLYEFRIHIARIETQKEKLENERFVVAKKGRNIMLRIIRIILLSYESIK